MGIQFVVGNVTAVYEDEAYGQTINRLLSDLTDTDVPLGIQLPEGESFNSAALTGIDLGWSFWNELKGIVRSTDGLDPCPIVTGVYAWAAVFINARVGPSVIWPLGEESPDDNPVYDDDPAINEAMRNLVEENAAPRNIRHGIQVFDLMAFMAELERIATALGYGTDLRSMIDLGKRYVTDDMSDEDPGVQALVHALTACHRALELNAPVWFVK